MSALFVVGISQQSRAGAWPTPVGKGQIIQTTMIDNAGSAYDKNGDNALDVQFSKSESSVFWEHGLSDEITLVLQSSIQDVNFTAGVDQVSFTGLGESIIGARRVMWRGNNTIVSAQASLVVPSAGETISDGDLGIGATHGEARVLIGRSFKLARRDGFVDVQAAWRIRGGGAPNEYRIDGTAGWRPVPKVQILAQGFYTKGNYEAGIARKNTRFKLQGALVYERNAKTSYQVGLYRTVAGTYIVKEKAVFVSVWQRY